MGMNKIKLNDFINAMQLGREIEFSIESRKFFLQPFYDDYKFQELNSIPKFVIYDCSNFAQPCKLICGTMEEILNYIFWNGNTLNRNFQHFVIDYIL